jgi:hypothetical protein
MFRIPSFYEMNVTFDDACRTIKNFGNGDMLEGMEAMNRAWEEHCFNEDDDDDFFEHFEYEVNAFNKVFSKMKPLFV